ncbi:MAG: hypothetical protein V4731_06335 [Pseudomonadota bacterium]
MHYRNQLRTARYAALADAESFSEICFALEALGLRLLGEQATLERYKNRIAQYALQSPVLNELAINKQSRFKPFAALYRTVQTARNDAMHIGAYARHATDAAIELCIGLEEALMKDVERTVGNLMVASPVTVTNWQIVAHARQLMLMHSFSFLPVRLDEAWWLIAEIGLAKFLSVNHGQKKIRLGMTIQEANLAGMEMIKVDDQDLLRSHMSIAEVLNVFDFEHGQMLWLVIDDDHLETLAGVLSPFELM